MSETDITHGVLYTKEEHGSIYDNYWKEEEKRYKKELERQEKMNILLTMSKEELEVLKEIATNRINLKEEIKNLEDDLTLHEETSFEFQEDNIKLRKVAEILARRVIELEAMLDDYYVDITVADINNLIDETLKEVEKETVADINNLIDEM